MRAVAVCSVFRRAATASTPNIPVAVRRHRAMAGLMIAVMAIAVMVVIAVMVAIAAMEAAAALAELLSVGFLMVVCVFPLVLLRRPAAGTAVVEAAGAEAAVVAGGTDGGH